MKPRRLIAALVLASAVAGCGSGRTAGTPALCPSGPGPASGQGLEAWRVRLIRLSNSAHQVERYAAAHFTDYYAGVAIACGGAGLDIYRRAGSTFDTSIRPYVAGVPVTFHEARYSKAELDKLAARITADTGYWAHRHITIEGATADQIGSAVVVEVPEPEAARAPLQDRYGAAMLRVVRISPAPG